MSILNPDNVVCDRSRYCDWHRRDVQRGCGCGGTVPHYHAHCEPCPVYPEAKCVPVCAVCKERPAVDNGECRRCHADH